jgi:hypothetical protein
MSEADDRYLAEVAEDCRSLLGEGIELLQLDLLRAEPIRLSARYRLDTVEWETVGLGGHDDQRHANLRSRLVLDRIALGMAVLSSGSCWRARETHR